MSKREKETKQIVGFSLGFYLCIASITGVIATATGVFNEEITMYVALTEYAKFFGIATIFVAIFVIGCVLINKYEHKE